jgi:hypothetical protein
MHVRTGDPELAREINRALVLEYLRKHEMISRAEITRMSQFMRSVLKKVRRSSIKFYDVCYK